MLADPVEQCYGEGPPFHDRLVARRERPFEQHTLLGPEGAGIDQQAAIAVFRQAGQRIEPGRP